MITAVVYAESGGTYKSTMTANIAVAFQRMGLKTLVIDLDPQTGNLSKLFRAADSQADPEADNLVKHIFDMGDGDFFDIIETSEEGVDLIPAHGMLGDFTSTLERKITYETGMKSMSREDYPRYEILYNLLWKTHNLNEHYDAILIDPNARAEDLLYNAIYAMRTLIAPVKPAGKGSLSIDGLEELVGNMETQLDINIGLSCVIPCEVGQTGAHGAYMTEFTNRDDLAIPASIGSRESMMDDMWEAGGSAFKVIEERWKTRDVDGGKVSEPGQRRVPEREVETLSKLYRIAYYVANETFEMEGLDPVLDLDIDEYEPRSFDVRGDEPVEVTAP